MFDKKGRGKVLVVGFYSSLFYQYTGIGWGRKGAPGHCQLSDSTGGGS